MLQPLNLTDPAGIFSVWTQNIPPGYPIILPHQAPNFDPKELFPVWAPVLDGHPSSEAAVA